MRDSTLFEIDPLGGDLLDAADVRALLAEVTGRRVALSSVYSFMSAGRAGVRLPTVRIVGKRMTSPDALRWWLRTTSELLDAEATVEEASVPAHPIELRRAAAVGLGEREDAPRRKKVKRSRRARGGAA